MLRPSERRRKILQIYVLVPKWDWRVHLDICPWDKEQVGCLNICPRGIWQAGTGWQHYWHFPKRHLHLSNSCALPFLLIIVQIFNSQRFHPVKIISETMKLWNPFQNTNLNSFSVLPFCKCCLNLDLVWWTGVQVLRGPGVLLLEQRLCFGDVLAQHTLCDIDHVSN